MTSKAILELLQMCCWFSGTVLHLLPTQIELTKHRVLIFNRLISPKVITIWWTLLSTTWFFIVAELTSNLMFYRRNKLVIKIYQMYILLIRSTTICLVYGFRKRACEIAHLLNCIFRKYRANSRPNSKFAYKKQDTIFVFSLFLFSGGLCFVYSILLPIISLSIPCLYESPFTKFLHWRCSSIFFQVTIFFIELVSLFPTSAVGSMIVPVYLTAMHEMNSKLQHLW